MASSHSTDLNLSAKDLGGLASADAIAAFFNKLGYDTSARKPLTPEAIGLAGDAAAAIKRIELLSEDAEGFLRVVFVQLRSLTAKSRYELSRVLGRTNVDHLLVLSSDFSALEFVLLDKRRRDHRGPGGVPRIQVVPLTVALARKAAGGKELRTVRRFTWTCRDGLEQFDKLRGVFEAAAFSEDYFCNRALFADHYLLSRLREDAAWAENPTQPFLKVKELLREARQRLAGKGEDLARRELFEPLFELLGFKATAGASDKDDPTQPDYLLGDPSGKPLSAAFVYAWDRWLDGPDFNNDQHAPDHNPGAAVVTALDQGVADWIIVTNGRQWRLYSRQAHSRATNFYEVDLPEALVASGDSDPNEAFRYWWLFFRRQAFQPAAGAEPGCWLDSVAAGSRDYAKTLGERLKERIFLTIFPHLAQGFLADRKARLGLKHKLDDDELRDTFEATLTLLYRLLFLLYAEARDLLPIREAPYREVSLKKIKDEIAAAAGVAESEVDARLEKNYAKDETGLYDRLQKLFAAMDRGAPTLNVPTYNGGLFITATEQAGGAAKADDRERRIARFLVERKVPDRFLALAIDHLARDPDDKTFELVPIDYKSLEVRHLGSIYEGLLEFKLKIADEDLAAQTDKKAEKYIPLAQAKARRGRQAEAVVRKGAVYLSNDKAERKASGSYYTPDPIVEYIVEQSIGPVLAERLEALRGEFRQVRKTFDNELRKATAFPVRGPAGETREPREFAADKTLAAHKELAERLFEFRALDPAMGSGHFLVGAVDFITDRLLTFLNQFPINPVTFLLDRTRRHILEALAEQGVSVDPDKLTDVNLLKRHVLKRCIYGVDLNPMAVELAKVSLWLDAFTLGAPLSFLDHHLRCGNSLVGATFEDLRSATRGRLFGIDYEPLLRAIHHVLLVNKMADATAAEVKQSASEYARAREDLSGYQIVLDLLVARHFGFPKAPGLLEHGDNLDLTSRARFIASLDDLEELALVERVENLARQADRRFFHWEIEFPEVFFGFADANERQLKHKDEIVAGSAGFDVVVGNPPWGQKDIDADLSFKEYVWAHYGSTKGIFDLFRPFVERDTRLLTSCGATGIVLPDIVLLKDYVETRRHILETLSLHHIDWWGMAFGDAVIDSATIIGIRGPVAPNHLVRVQVHDAERPLVQDMPQAGFWANPRIVFNLHLTPEKRRVLGRLASRPRIGDYFEVHEGVHSGNIRADLFVEASIDDTCREMYFGRDEIAPYHLEWHGRYIRLAALPRKRSRQRYANAGRREWHERQKLLVRRTGDFVLSAVDDAHRYASNNFFVVFPSVCCDLDLYGLCALLNSKFMTWYFRTIEPRRGRVFAELKIKHLADFPLPLLGPDRDTLALLNALGRQRSGMVHRCGCDTEANGTQSDQVNAVSDLEIETAVRKLFELPDDFDYEASKDLATCPEQNNDDA